MLFLSGVVPGTMIMLFILATFMVYSILWFGVDIKYYDLKSSTLMKNRSVVDIVESDNKSPPLTRKGVVIIFILNATVVLAANAFYIYAYSNFRNNVVILIQQLLAIFKGIWN